MNPSINLHSITRRRFGLACGAGIYAFAVPITGNAAAKKVPTATGIDALFVPFVVAAELKIFEKYGLETSFKPFDDGNVALDALLTGNSDIGATTELGGLSRWDKGGKLYVTSYSSTSGKQIGLAGRDDIKKPEDLIGRTVAYPRATGGHLYFMRYLKKYNLPADKIKVKLMQAPEMVAALERRDIDAFFLWQPWLDKAAQLVQGAKVLAGSGDDGVLRSRLLRLLFARADRRQATGARRDEGAHGSDGFLHHQPGRGGEGRRQGLPHSGSRHEALHEPHDVSHGDAEGRRAEQFPGRRRARAGGEHHQEDAGLERLHSSATHEGGCAGSVRRLVGPLPAAATAQAVERRLTVAKNSWSRVT